MKKKNKWFICFWRISFFFNWNSKNSLSKSIRKKWWCDLSYICTLKLKRSQMIYIHLLKCLSRFQELLGGNNLKKSRPQESFDDIEFLGEYTSPIKKRAIIDESPQKSVIESLNDAGKETNEKKCLLPLSIHSQKKKSPIPSLVFL